MPIPLNIETSADPGTSVGVSTWRQTKKLAAPKRDNLGVLKWGCMRYLSIVHYYSRWRLLKKRNILPSTRAAAKST